MDTKTVYGVAISFGFYVGFRVTQISRTIEFKEHLLTTLKVLATDFLIHKMVWIGVEK